MTVKRTSAFASAWFACACLLAGCASEPPPAPGPARILFPHATINGLPVRLVLDTGAASTVLYNETARRAGLTFGPPRHDVAAGEFEIVTEMSSPARMKVGTQSFTARLPIFTLPASTAREDGVVGWPEIRDNLLLFDSNNGDVRRLDQVPSNVSAWVKLKVRPHDTLFLDVPLDGGRTGCLLIDTGAPQGVQLPPARWQEFKASHAGAPAAAISHSTWTSGAFKTETLSADHIQLGPLTLTNVPVEKMPASENAWLSDVAAGDEVLGVIGLAGLARMDLIVDAKNGLAWARPRSSVEPGVRPFKTGILLTAGNLYLRSGLDYASTGNVDRAITEYTRAIASNPERADIYADRAVARQLQGNFSGALADYNKMIALHSSDSIVAQLHRQTLLRRLGRADADFSNAVATWDEGWTKTMGLFLAGRLDEKNLLAAATELNQQCEAFYYIACEELCRGDKERAREFFQKCVATNVKEYTEYQFAAAELARLDHSTPIH